MSRDDFVVETPVDHQILNDETTIIAHDPAFVQPAVDPLTNIPTQTENVVIPPFMATGQFPLGKPETVLFLDFSVPVPGSGFQYQIVTFATWSVSGNNTELGNTGNFNSSTFSSRVEFTLADTVSSRSDQSSITFNSSPLPVSNGTLYAEDHFLPIEPGVHRATLSAINFTNGSFADAKAFVSQASILVTLKLVKIRPRIRIALPLSPHRGNKVSIVASNVNVDVFSPLTTDAPATKVASIVAGERIDAIFAGVQDQSLSAQWQIALLNPSGGAIGPIGAAGDTIIGPIGPKGGTGPTGPSDGRSLFVYSKDGNGTPGNYDVMGNDTVDFHVIGNSFGFTNPGGTKQFFKLVSGSGTAKWRFDYYIRGNGIVSDLPDYVTPLEFAIFKNLIEVVGSRFTSNPIPGGPSSISATGALTIAIGDVLELRNVTGGGSETVSVISGNPGTAVSTSFTLTPAT
jgi:hypothetical protein